MNGNNILTMTNYDVENDVVDLAVNDLGYLYAIYDDGFLAEYDPAGNLLFAFDVTESTSNIIGQIKSPTAIAIDEAGMLFCLDGAGNAIVAYAPTDFADLVHQAIGRYNEGAYLESTGLFEAILRQNANFALAHAALGKAYYQQGDYEASLIEYRLANDIAGYSETYWKIRDGWLKDNLSWIFIVLILLSVASAVLKRVDRKTAAFSGIHRGIEKVAVRTDVRRFSLVFHILKDPADAFFQIKRLHRGTPASASVLIAVLFVEYLVMLRYTGFVFNSFADTVNLVGAAVGFFGVFFLFVFSNYLISTLSDGEGWLKDVYVGTAYALSPLIIGWLPLTLVSNVLTLNESVLYQLASAVLYGWTAILIFLSAKEIHNYEIGETVKNLLMTLFAMIGFVLGGLAAAAWIIAADQLVAGANPVRPNRTSATPESVREDRPAAAPAKQPQGVAARPQPAIVSIAKPLITQLQESDVVRTLGGIMATGGTPDVTRLGWPTLRAGSPQLPFLNVMRDMRAALTTRVTKDTVPVMAVIGADDGGDRSIAALNIALSAARDGARVLLIDADQNALGLSNKVSHLDKEEPGRLGWLSMAGRTARTIKTANGISILPAVKASGTKAAEAICKAIAHARSAGDYDLVVIDGPAMPWSPADHKLLETADGLAA
ncbi:MAG: YIP1 family protein, partial [Bacillota bacterium]|nr:YIP1 family protein [Bacillota bacterium]